MSLHKSDRDPAWCDACQNTGWINCYCGGDLCICDNNGEYECPYCQSVACEYDDAGGYEEEA